MSTCPFSSAQTCGALRLGNRPPAVQTKVRVDAGVTMERCQTVCRGTVGLTAAPRTSRVVFCLDTSLASFATGVMLVSRRCSFVLCLCVVISSPPLLLPFPTPLQAHHSTSWSLSGPSSAPRVSSIALHRAVTVHAKNNPMRCKRWKSCARPSRDNSSRTSDHHCGARERHPVSHSVQRGFGVFTVYRDASDVASD